MIVAWGAVRQPANGATGQPMRQREFLGLGDIQHPSRPAFRRLMGWHHVGQSAEAAIRHDNCGGHMRLRGVMGKFRNYAHRARSVR